MSIIAKFRQNSLYLLVVSILIAGFYIFCDYHLSSVAEELMLNWAHTEAMSIREGSLLTSITKTQRFIISSSYVRGVRLVKIDADAAPVKIEFGNPFEISTNDVKQLKNGLTQTHDGFLHQRAYYRIPEQNDFILVFDVKSGLLDSLFIFSTGVIIVLVAFLIWKLRQTEANEAKRREELLRLAIENLIDCDKSSEVIEKEIPGLYKWWITKRNELEIARLRSIENQSKVLFGELASKTVHDIKGALRNIRETTKALNEIKPNQKDLILRSAEKISQISQSLLEQTRLINEEDESAKIEIELEVVLASLIQYQQNQYRSTIDLEFAPSKQNSVHKISVDPSEFERTISNLIDNAVEASNPGSKIRITINDLISEANTNSYAERIAISIQDFGCGIPKESLLKLGVKGFTEGKAKGNGLGFYYAKRFAESNGGFLKVTSEIGVGTTVCLVLPKALENPANFSKSITLEEDEYLIVIDDQESIRSAVSLKLQSAQNQGLRYKIFSNSKELESWIASHTSKFTLYSDYFLELESETGLQIIKRLGVEDRAILFTSAHNDPNVIEAAKKIGVPILSKDEFLQSTIAINRSAEKLIV